MLFENQKNLIKDRDVIKNVLNLIIETITISNIEVSGRDMSTRSNVERKNEIKDREIENTIEFKKYFRIKTTRKNIFEISNI